MVDMTRFMHCKETLMDVFDTSTFEEVQGINDTSVTSAEPSVNEDLGWIVFVRSLITAGIAMNCT